MIPVIIKLREEVTVLNKKVDDLETIVIWLSDRLDALEARPQLVWLGKKP